MKKLKPSEWIKQRFRDGTDALLKDGVKLTESDITPLWIAAILDYLDQQEDNLTK